MTLIEYNHTHAHGNGSRRDALLFIQASSHKPIQKQLFYQFAPTLTLLKNIFAFYLLLFNDLQVF